MEAVDTQVPTDGSEKARHFAKLSSLLRTVFLALLVTVVSYLAAWVGVSLFVSHETTAVSAFYPGEAVLVSVLLLVSRPIWPWLILAGVVGWVLATLQIGAKPTALFFVVMSAGAAEALIAALGLRYSFDDMPRLNSWRALAKYSLITVFAIVFGASVGAAGLTGSYWANWFTWYLGNILTFLTVIPAILGWAGVRPRRTREFIDFLLETALLLGSLALLGSIAFLSHWERTPAALLFCFVPFLLWAAIRFGSLGVSSSMIVIAFLSIWGNVHGRGPFTGPEPFRSVLSLQLFLLSSAIPFMALAVLVEERKQTEVVLRDSEERFRLAAQAGKMFAYEWDAATDIIRRSGEFVQVLGSDEATQTTGRKILAQVHEADRERVMAAFAALSPEKPDLRISFRMLRADGTTIWVERSSRAEFNKQGRLNRIVGMVADITQRKHAEEQLQESEERFRLVATTAPVMIWMSGPDKLCTYFNQPWLTFTGRPIHQELGNGWAAGVHAEDLERCLETYKQAFDRREPFDMEYRLRRHDGEYRWIFDYGVPRFNSDGSFAGYIGSASDLTDQKVAREALEKVSGQLIEAQEKERRRLARELHDDICQRLAMLSLKIEKVSKSWAPGQSFPAHQLEQIWQQCSDLTVDVQALSHELHPSILDNLGLVTAVRSFCREVSEHSGVVVEFDSRELPASLPSEVSLSLFRVVQEALRNAVKYSGQKHCEVRLQEVSGELELEVRDEGVGFDATSGNSGGGLGLVSMAERIHQVNGTFTIDSHPNAGTRIRARVPVTPQKGRAASAS